MSLMKLINIGGLFCHNGIHWLQSGKLLKLSLKSGFLNVGFEITSRVQIRDAGKLLFVLTSDCRECTIAFFYLLDLFESLFIIPISCNGFQHCNCKSFRTIVNINLQSMWITVFLNTFPNVAI